MTLQVRTVPVAVAGGVGGGGEAVAAKINDNNKTDRRKGIHLPLDDYPEPSALDPRISGEILGRIVPRVEGCWVSYSLGFRASPGSAMACFGCFQRFRAMILPTCAFGFRVLR